MRLTMKDKQKITEMQSKRYQRGGKKEKTKMLDEFTQLTGYNRAYGSYVLNNWGKRIYLTCGTERVVFVLGKRKKKIKRKREKSYGDDILKLLKKIWGISGLICSKLLKAYITNNLKNLEGHGEIKINKKQRKKLLRISHSTIDRMLSKERKRMLLKRRSLTKPGTLLKHKIPIRTYADWNENRPGFLELDLVSHEGGDPSGEFIQTLDATDIYSGWTDTEAVRNKAQVFVFKGIVHIRKRLPFEMLGIDNDNGSEFINDHLYRYCKKENITFTRSRPLRKNDNCHVEQKNYSVVRKTVGYERYETEEELRLLNEIYSLLRLITNYFTPSMKLISKERIGSKVIKKYDEPKTPCRRLLECPYISDEDKEKLKRQHNELNPAKLKREILQLQKKLSEAVRNKKRKRRVA